jgi:hypothetical protein
VVIEQGIEFFEKFDIQNKDINMDNKFEILNEILDLFLTEYHYIPPVSSEKLSRVILMLELDPKQYVHEQIYYKTSNMCTKMSIKVKLKVK